jgi:endonuclease-3
MSEILDKLEEVYKEEGTELRFHTPFQLLVAVILSAQCTDTRVNKVTETLFKKYREPKDFAELGLVELGEMIKSCGCYRVKAQSIINTSKMILEDFGGKVPDNMEDLLKLDGVGRKTANVVLANAFGKNAIAVDTHVYRVSRRLGFTEAFSPEGVEKDLMRLIPEEKWSRAHHWLIWHGRRVCKARNPLCGECFLKELCPYDKKNSHI